MTINLGSAHGSIVIDTNDMRSGIGRARDDLLSLESVAKNAGVVIAGAFAATGAAILGATVKAGQMAADMEQSLADTAAIMNLTRDEVAPLGDLIQQLGVDPNLKVTADQAAQAIQMLARNGLTMTEIMDGAAKSTVVLANATGADFGNAADIATDTMAIFNIEAENMQDAVDGIVSVTNNSKFTIDDYALALAQGGGAASAAGVEFDDFNTTIAAISPLFASGSDAGTSFKTMITRLTPASNAASDAMAALGIITEDGANQFYDAEGNLKSMAEIAGILETSLGDLSEQQRTQYLNTIFGADAMRAAVGVMQTGEEGFASMADTMSQTDALANAATRMDTLKGVVELVTGVFESLALTFGQAVLPIARALADEFRQWVETILPNVETALQTFSGVVTSFLGNLGEGMSVVDAFIEAIWDIAPPAVLNALVTMRDSIREIIPAIQSVIGVVVEFVSTHAEAFKGALIAIGAAIAAAGIVAGILAVVGAVAALVNPVTLVIAAVGALGAAWATDWNGIRTTTLEIIEWLKPYVAQLVEHFRMVWDNISSVFSVFSALFTGDWETFGYELVNLWFDLWEQMVEFFTTIWERFKTALDGLFTKFGEWFQGQDWSSLARRIIDGLIGGLTAGAQAVVDALAGVIDGAIAAAKERLGISSPSKVMIDIADNVTGTFANRIADTNAVAAAMRDMATSGVVAAQSVQHSVQFMPGSISAPGATPGMETTIANAVRLEVERAIGNGGNDAYNRRLVLNGF
jgi:TP901 family phage tail tape measure protein